MFVSSNSNLMRKLVLIVGNGASIGLVVFACVDYFLFGFDYFRAKLLVISALAVALCMAIASKMIDAQVSWRSVRERGRRRLR